LISCRFLNFVVRVKIDTGNSLSLASPTFFLLIRSKVVQILHTIHEHCFKPDRNRPSGYPVLLLESFYMVVEATLVIFVSFSPGHPGVAFSPRPLGGLILQVRT
jgi:hypothetical protein